MRTMMTIAALAAAAVAARAADDVVDETKIFPGDPIIITAIAEPARASEVPFGVSSITAGEIRSIDVTNVAEALVRAEGVHVREYGGGGSNRTLSLRGGLAKQTLVMVDGQPRNNPQGGDVDFNAIPLENIERVEVLAGPSSALYGAGATAGVVNIITRGRPEAPTASFRGSGGSGGELNGELAGGVPAGRFGVRAGGNYRRSDGFRENDDYEGKGANAGVTYDLGGDRELFGRGQYQLSALGVPGSLSYPSPRARENDEFVGGNLGFDGPLSSGDSLSARVSYKRQDRRYEDPDFLTRDHHRTDTTGGRAVNFYQLRSWNRLALGGEAEHAHTVSTAIGDVYADSWGAFAQEDLRFGRTTTVLGVRYDYSGRYGDAVSPRAGVRHWFNDYVGVRAAAGRAFRAPTFDELFWPQSLWGGGNPNLRPEFCWTYEAGPSFAAGDRLYADVAFFRSDYADLISGWPPENIGQALIQGVEAGVNAVPVAALPGLAVQLSGTYLRSKDKETGRELDYRPRITAFGELRYTHYFVPDAVAVTPSASAETTGRQLYAGPTGGWLPAYTLLNARLALKLYYPEIYVACKNLANTDYQAVYDYPMPRRTFLGGVAITF